MTDTPAEHRSGCPINLTLEMLGDRWSLIVIRDVMFGNRRHFREILSKSEERIASNILADRLKKLVAAGLLWRTDDASHKQKAVYSLTEPAIQLVPLLVHMGPGAVATPRSRKTSPSAPNSWRPAARACGRPLWPNCVPSTSGAEAGKFALLRRAERGLRRRARPQVRPARGRRARLILNRSITGA